MVKNTKLQCESKHVLIEIFDDNTSETTAIPVQVYVLANKKSIKQYCKDTAMPFNEGISRLYIPLTVD